MPDPGRSAPGAAGEDSEQRGLRVPLAAQRAAAAAGFQDGQHPDRGRG